MYSFRALRVAAFHAAGPEQGGGGVMSYIVGAFENFLGQAQHLVVFPARDLQRDHKVEPRGDRTPSGSLSFKTVEFLHQLLALLLAFFNTTAAAKGNGQVSISGRHLSFASGSQTLDRLGLHFFLRHTESFRVPFLLRLVLKYARGVDKHFGVACGESLVQPSAAIAPIIAGLHPETRSHVNHGVAVARFGRLPNAL